jgi:hypothetical protein
MERRCRQTPQAPEPPRPGDAVSGSSYPRSHSRIGVRVLRRGRPARGCDGTGSCSTRRELGTGATRSKPGPRCRLQDGAPPGRSAPRRSLSRASGSGHIPKLLTASALSNISLKSRRSRVDPSRSSTRPCSQQPGYGRPPGEPSPRSSRFRVRNRRLRDGQLADRESRAEADLQDVVLRLHLQQSDRPLVPVSVRQA